jgi:hypothetical protein
MFRFIAFRHFLGAASVALTLAAPVAHAQTCPFDNGGSSLENDGLVLTRYALGLRGAPMVANTAFAAGDATTIESNINCPSCGLRVTDDKDGLNNPIFTVADATIISRKIAGFTGPALTNGIASLGTGTRNTPAAVQSFLLAGCGATGGTVTNITAGTGLTGGTITNAGVIAADTTYLQRRVAMPCGTGSFVTAIAADGTPSCGTPSAGGSGTVTSVGAGYGLVANGPNVVGNAVVSSGLIELANGYILPQGCTAGQVPKSGGAGNWLCAADNAGGGATNAFVQGGNAFGATAVLGNTDNQELQVKTGSTTLRIFTRNSAGFFLNETVGAGYRSLNTNGGSPNNVSPLSAVGGTIAGGGAQLLAAVGTDYPNSVTASYGSIGGGLGNSVTGYAGTVAGGQSNIAGGDYSVALGNKAQALHPHSFVFGGSPSTGVVTQTQEAGEFVARAPGGVRFISSRGITLDAFDGPIITRGWSVFDATAPAEKRGVGMWRLFMEPHALVAGMPYTSGKEFQVRGYVPDGSAVNLMRVTATGNVVAINGFFAREATFSSGGLYVSGAYNGSTSTIATGSGAALTVGGVWTNASDRNVKENIEPISARVMLAKVAALPLSTWNYIAEGRAVRHVGPMAQDFSRIFKLGNDDKSIGTVDSAGVALAAIQGLHQMVKAKDAKISALEKANATMLREMAVIKKKLGM